MGESWSLSRGLWLGGSERRDWHLMAIERLIKEGAFWRVSGTDVVVSARMHGFRCGREGRRRESCPFRSEAAQAAWIEGFVIGRRERLWTQNRNVGARTWRH